MPRLLCLALAVALFVPAVARADESGKRKEVRDRIHALVLARVVDRLALTPDEAAKLLPLVSKYLEDTAPLVKDSGAARREIRRLLGEPKVDAAKVNAEVDRLLADRQKITALQDGLLHEARRVLPIEKSARLAVAFPQITRRVEGKVGKALEKVKKAKAKRHRGAEAE